MLTKVAPKLTSAEFKPSSIRLLVERADGRYDYYPIKLGDRKGLFAEILVTPPVIADGLVRYERKLYAVTKRDILRRRINVAHPVIRASQPDIPSASSGVPGVDVAGQAGAGEQPGSGPNLDEQILQSANLVFEEQMRTLYGAED